MLARFAPLMAGVRRTLPGATKPQSDMALAGAGVADRDDVLAALDVLRARQFHHERLFKSGNAAKSKLSRLFTVGNTPRQSGIERPNPTNAPGTSVSPTPAPATTAPKN
jgi:hypothetical protein